MLTVLLTVIILLNLPLPTSMRIKAGAHNTVAPFQNTMSLFTRKIADISSSVLHPNRNSSKKKAMLSQIAQLQFELNEMKIIKEENVALRKIINFRNRETKELLICEVIARLGSDGWWQTVTINRGDKDGITKGSAVLTTEGLIGRINAVSKNTSTIQLITDYNCNISCILPRTKSFGIVKGQGVSIDGNTVLEMLAPINPLKMDYISKEITINKDDLIITSGLGKIFPAGLIVGHITKTRLDRSGLYQHATIIPAADLSKLHYVFVIKQPHNNKNINLKSENPDN